MISIAYRIASLTILLTMLTGCATAIATAHHGPSKQKVRTQVMSDEVVAIARPKQSEQQVTSSNLNGLVMIGLNHSYHITSGGEIIE